MPGPLDHLTVIELATEMPVAIAGMLLADHGADVLKVESKGGACFAHELSRKSWDRSKRSVELDVDADRQSLLGLLAGADIFIHALEDDAAAFGPEALQRQQQPLERAGRVHRRGRGRDGGMREWRGGGQVPATFR